MICSRSSVDDALKVRKWSRQLLKQTIMMYMFDMLILDKRDFRALPADGAIMKNAKMSSGENRVCVGLFKFKINYLNRRLVRRQVSRRLIWINRPSNKMYVTCAHMSDPVKPLSYRSRPQSHVQTIRVRMRHWVTRRSTRIQAVWHSDNIFTKFEGLWSTLVICIRRQT